MSKHRICNNLLVTCESRETAERVEEFIENVMGYKNNKLGTKIEEEEEVVCPMFYLCKAIMLMSAHSFKVPEELLLLVQQAQKHNEVLKQKGVQLEQWEENWLEIFGYWMVRNKVKLHQTFLKNARECPNDLLNMRVGMVFGLYTGHKMFLKTLGELHCQYSANMDNPCFMSLQAFIFEELNQYDKSEEIARRSLCLDPDNLWTQHVIAHILYSTQRVQECIQFLEQRRPRWKQNGNEFINKHISWHLAITYLEQNNISEGTAIIDEMVSFPFCEAECPLSLLGYILRVFVRTGNTESIKDTWIKCAVDYLNNCEIYTKHMLFDCLSFWFLAYYSNTKFNSKFNSKFNTQAILDRAWQQVKQNVKQVEYDIDYFQQDYLQLLQGMVEFGNKEYQKSLHCMLPFKDRIRYLGASDEQILVMYEAILFCLVRCRNRTMYDQIRETYFVDYKDSNLLQQFETELETKDIADRDEEQEELADDIIEILMNG